MRPAFAAETLLESAVRMAPCLNQILSLQQAECATVDPRLSRDPGAGAALAASAMAVARGLRRLGQLEPDTAAQAPTSHRGISHRRQSLTLVRRANRRRQSSCCQTRSRSLRRGWSRNSPDSGSSDSSGLRPQLPICARFARRHELGCDAGAGCAGAKARAALRRRAFVPEALGCDGFQHPLREVGASDVATAPRSAWARGGSRIILLRQQGSVRHQCRSSPARGRGVPASSCSSGKVRGCGSGRWRLLIPRCRTPHPACDPFRHRREAAWLGRYACWMPNGSHLGGYDALPLLYTLIVFAAALFLPVLLGRFISSPEPPNSDSTEGDGGSPPGPPTPPGPSPGGVPLDNAEPARVRLRDHRRLQQLLPARQRRPAPERPRGPARRSPKS